MMYHPSSQAQVEDKWIESDITFMSQLNGASKVERTTSCKCVQMMNECVEENYTVSERSSELRHLKARDLIISWWQFRNDSQRDTLFNYNRCSLWSHIKASRAWIYGFFFENFYFHSSAVCYFLCSASEKSAKLAVDNCISLTKNNPNRLWPGNVTQQ